MKEMLKENIKKNDIIRDVYVKARELYYKCLFSDEGQIRKQFKGKMGRNVELNNPVRFNDKVQWLKLYWYDPVATKCADKYEVRKFVSSLAVFDSRDTHCYCMYWEVFTPSVWNILLELDNEKMNVIERLGCPKISYVDACKYRNTLDENMDATAVFFEYTHSPNVVQGPHVVDSRYITEDVSQGLVLLESLAKKFNISTPICSALIDIAGAALKKDFRREGRTLERLGAKNVLKIIDDCKYV